MEKNLVVPVISPNQGDSDSVDVILADFAAYLRTLKRNGAHASIHILADYFISIARCFTITTSEYEYFLDKYHGSELGDTDLSQTKIVAYLKSLIDRLESVTGITLNSADLHLSSEPSAEPEACFQTEIEEVQQLKQELAEYPELSEILDETLTPPKSLDSGSTANTEPVKIHRSNFIRKPSRSPTPASGGDPDLVNILDQLPTLSPQTESELHEDTILRTVESLESFAFGEKVPLFKLLNNETDSSHSQKK